MNSSFYEERVEIAALLEDVVRRHLAESAIPSVNDIYEAVFDRDSVGRHPERREMRFFIGDLAAFTPALANRVRTEVLCRFRKWTVVPQYGAKSFTISAGTVSFGSKRLRSPITDATEEYRRWLRAARRYDEVTTGPLRRQFRHLTPLIPAAVWAVREGGAAVLAAFDTFVPPVWQGNPIVWVLTPGGTESPEMRPGIGRARVHAVDVNGRIEEEYCQKYWPATDEPSPFFLLAHEFPWEGRHRLELVFRGWGDQPRDTVIGPLRVNDLLRDADLKDQQRRAIRRT